MKGAVVLGVNPPVHDFTFFDLWAKPLGLLFLLDYLRKRGNRVFLADCIFEGRTESFPSEETRSGRLRFPNLPASPPFRDGITASASGKRTSAASSNVVPFPTISL